ncbi:MAG TPA: response regulator [Vicinamibacterales bacterium]|nr:response regulator [Vicinamibacterales bacterium]
MARTILIVEDDEATRVGLLVLLAEAGYRTIGAGTLKQATELLAQQNPDLMVVDVRLGGDNGLQLVAMAIQPIPAIVTTAFADPILEAEARQFGADFMVKPLSPRALIELIGRKLAEAVKVPTTARRWPRKQISSSVPVLVGDSPARIVDVGYGGVRLEVESDRNVPDSFRLTLSGHISVPVNVVWNRRRGDIWQYGVAVNEEHQPAWRELVDTLS